MSEKAKLITIFVLLSALAALMVGYFFIAKDDATLKGGFLTLVGYLVKKIADEWEEVIDMFWGIKNDKPPGGSNAA